MTYIKLTRPSMCAMDEHEMLYYYRKSYTPKPELPKGTILKVKEYWANLYGGYYRCETEDGVYDIPSRNAIEVESQNP